MSKALKELKENFTYYQLDYLFKLVNLRAQKCQFKKGCICSDSEKIFEMLSDLIKSNEALFRKKINQFELEPEKMTINDTIEEDPISTEHLKEICRGVTIRDVQNFFDRLNNDFIEASHNHLFDFHYHRNVCDCPDFYQYTFHHVSQGSYKRILYCLRNFSRPVQRHGTVATAIFCYFVENNISARPEMQRSRDRINCPDRLSFWMRIIHKHITREHARDRKKKFENYRLVDAAEPSRAYNEIFNGWKRDFPLFFTADGRINENALKYPDIGPKFVCAQCKLNYVKTVAISCVKPKSRMNEVYPVCHEMCRKCIRKEVAGVQFPITVNSSGVGMKCPHALCINPIRTEDFIHLLDSPDRIEIRRRILRALVKDFGHATLESLDDSDTQQNSDSDSDEYMASPEEVGRILTCDNDSDNNADAI